MCNPLDPDRAYANSAFIPGSEALPALWAQKAAGFRAQLEGRARLALPYGPLPRNRFDLFLPETAPHGLMVFVHGGYWMETSRNLWSHLAAGATARGWACALPSYTLAPEARISQITAEVDAAIAAACALVSGPVCVTGHSAGGHLAARMGCADRSGTVAARVTRIVPISPVAELAPLLATQMQQTLQLDAAEIATESPARHALRAGVQAHVWVGGQERPAFLWQARTLSESWSCPWTVDPGTHHFDVIDGLERPDSPLMQACLDGL
jgi:acetyl esterase/lipase